jgi:hypothetical protein
MLGLLKASVVALAAAFIGEQRIWLQFVDL